MPVSVDRRSVRLFADRDQLVAGLVKVLQGLCILAISIAVASVLPTIVTVILGVLAFAALALFTRRDEVTLLSFFLICLFVIPANLIVGPIGRSGTPAFLVAIGLFVLWCVAKIGPGNLPRGRNPMRIAMLFYFLATLVAYVSGYLRGLPTDEASGADQAIIGLAAICGLVLFTCDCIRTREAFDTLLQRLTVGGAFLSFVGILQFVGINIAPSITLPGLVVGARDVTATAARSAFERVAGTGTHPIEFAVVLAMLFPIALHYALHAPKNRLGQRWVVLAFVTAGIPLAISRSGVITVLITGGAIALTWKLRRLGNALILAVIGFVGMQVAVPGLLGSIRSLFSSIGDDISIQGRTNDYDQVWTYFIERPLFGRGPGTFLPSHYLILDNDHLYQLVSMGLFGVLASIGMYLTAATLARGARKRAFDEETRHLGQALAGSMIGAVVAAATFDAGGFQIMFGTTYLLMGFCGAFWRLQKEQYERGSPSAHIPPASDDGPRDDGSPHGSLDSEEQLPPAERAPEHTGRQPAAG